MNYTPGPWTIEEVRNDLCRIWAPGTTFIADVHRPDGRYWRNKNNAKLIVAAPELLESLNELLYLLEHTLNISTDATERANNIIKKAIL